MTAADITVTGTTESPAVAFSNPGGTIGLDVARWSLVQGSLVIPTKPGLFDALNPLAGPQRCTLTAADAVAGTTREFDLGVRSVVASEGGTLTVELASDEAILEDYSPAADIRPFADLEATWGYTAGGIARMVLDEIGATVADPSPNPSLRPYWELQNLVMNPRFQTTTKGAATLAGSSSLVSTSHTAAGSAARRALQWTCATAGGEVVIAGYDPVAAKLSAIPCKPGDWVYAYAEVSAVAAGRGRTISISFHNADFTGGQIYTSAATSAPDTRWVSMSLLRQAPPGTAYVSIRVGGDPIAAGADQRMFAANVMAVNWEEPIPPFNGATPGDGAYTYSWDGTADDSTSTRYPVIERDPESLVWRAGVGGMSFLAPLLQSVGLRLVCDEQRVWTLRPTTYTAPGSTTLEYGVNAGTYELGNSLDDDGWCDAATIRYEWERNGIARTMDDTFEATTPPRKRIRLVLNTPYPGPGRAQNLVTRAQTGGLRTSASGLTQWPATADQAVTVITPEGTRQGVIGAVTFDLDTDTMNVTIRGEDVP